MIGFAKYFDDNKTMSVEVSDKKMFKKYIKMWRKKSSLMNIEFDSESVYCGSDKYGKTKIKS